MYKLYAITIALSSFLIFLIQPIIGKFLLPWFGGVPSVWSTSLMFFMLILLGGYAYAYWLLKRSFKWQLVIHFAVFILVAISMLWLLSFSGNPILPSAEIIDYLEFAPVFAVFSLLVIAIGLPYFFLSSTGILLQYWLGLVEIKRIPYRLYAISNASSIIALILYPFLIEPFSSVSTQSIVWSSLFVVYLFLMVGCAAIFGRKVFLNKNLVLNSSNRLIATEVISRVRLFRWFGLAFVPAFLLIATTAQLTQAVASIPFLWILPLVAYLLSFVLVFGGKNFNSWLVIFSTLLIAGFALAPLIMTPAIFVLTIVVMTGSLFLVGIFFHSRLYEDRPGNINLPTFYLMIAAGSAAAALVINFIIPAISSTYIEYQLGLIVAVWLMVRYFVAHGYLQKFPLPKTAFYFLILVLPASMIIANVLIEREGLLEQKRNFYGVINVRIVNDKTEELPRLALYHGSILHGVQYVSGESQFRPTSYYGPQSGAGRAIAAINEMSREEVRVGVLGLGVGTLAAYCRPVDHYKFYEINPEVVALANKHFSYLSNCNGRVELIMGDARLELQRELERNLINNFDVLVVDVFSDDSIPVHLLTKEALGLYLQHMNPQRGVIAVHISNRHLNLEPVLASLAKYYRLNMLVVSHQVDKLAEASSIYVLLSGSDEILQNPIIAEGATVYAGTETRRLWTDNYSNLFSIMKNKFKIRLSSF
jgi:hypothetical protein